CGLKTLTLDAANRLFPLLSLDGWGYDSELIYVALMRGLRVAEIDLRIVHDSLERFSRSLRRSRNWLHEFQEIWFPKRESLPGKRTTRASGSTREFTSR